MKFHSIAMHKKAAAGHYAQHVTEDGLGALRPLPQDEEPPGRGRERVSHDAHFLRGDREDRARGGPALLRTRRPDMGVAGQLG